MTADEHREQLDYLRRIAVSLEYLNGTIKTMAARQSVTLPDYPRGPLHGATFLPAPDRDLDVF